MCKLCLAIALLLAAAAGAILANVRGDAGAVVSDTLPARLRIKLHVAFLRSPNWPAPGSEDTE
jgi:hypothetical protein